MKTKQKLMICALISVFGSIGNVFFSAMVHGRLTQQIDTLKLVGFWENIGSMAANPQHRVLFFCLEGFVLVLAVMFYLTNLRPYQSDLDEITPDIQTPKAVGQYQHGSSRWLRESEKDKAFASFVLDPSDPQIEKLLETGYTGIDFLKKG